MVLSLGFSSCSEWLELKPKTESTRDDLFSTPQGYEDALTGVYEQMIGSTAYCGDLTFTTLDNMASLYVLDNTSNTRTKMKNHVWTDQDAESKIQTMFSKLYKIISSTNSLLEKIAENRDVFTDPVLYNTIYGEALGIRALCHLDVLRLFGPVPSEKTDERILPYVTTFGYETTPHSTYDEYVTLLLKDLSDAEKLLESDPIRPDAESTTDEFLTNRTYRMNYYAVKGLQAIANLYLGNKDAALQAALVVINAQDSSSKSLFTLGNASSFLSDDLLFSSEHVFALYDFELGSKYDSNFANGTLNAGSYMSKVKSGIYSNSAVDIRAPEIGKWWAMSSLGLTSYAICNKYETDDDDYSGAGHVVPLIRLAEMYLIAVECAPIAEAQEYWNTYQRSRNLTPTTLDELSLTSTLKKEYLKEFYAEGKMFYFYKRNNMTVSDILWADKKMSVNYVLPLPSDELTYE